jgi:hypothetical protein
MKKLIFTAVIIFGCLSFKTAGAQVTVSAGVNIGDQPEWGPTGYTHAQYYYMPDIDAYYDVPAHQYVYNENNVWVHRGQLPARYSNWDRYHGYKAVINERNPWERNEQMRARYAGYKNRHDQAIIRESNDPQYRNHYREVVYHQDLNRARVYRQRHYNAALNRAHVYRRRHPNADNRHRDRDRN